MKEEKGELLLVMVREEGDEERKGNQESKELKEVVGNKKLKLDLGVVEPGVGVEENKRPGLENATEGLGLDH